MFNIKNIIKTKFAAIFSNLEKKEATKNVGLYIYKNQKTGETEAFLFKNGKKDKKLSLEDVTKLMN